MLKNNKYLFIGLGVLACFVVGGILGWQLRTPDPPQIKVEKEIVRDTVEIPIYIHKTEVKTIELVDTIYQEQVPQIIYSDSLSGEKDNIAYSVFHKIFVSDTIKSFWDIDVRGKTLQLFETTSFDSIQTIHKIEYTTVPFFLNHWFYSTLLFFITTLSAILFI